MGRIDATEIPRQRVPGEFGDRAGHLDAGEDYLPCAVRELEEELGIRTTPERLALAGKVAAGPGTAWEFVELFITEHDGPLRWPAPEIETGQWFPPGEIDAWTAARCRSPRSNSLTGSSIERWPTRCAGT